MALTISSIGDDDNTIDLTSPLNGPSLTTSIYGNVVGSLSTTLPGSYVNTGTITAGTLTTAYPYSYGYNDTITITQPAPKTLHVDGDAEITGDLKLNGIKLSERLDKIEERLGILRPNNDLENKWEKLKALGEEYRRLEKEILEGESIWDTLKK